MLIYHLKLPHPRKNIFVIFIQNFTAADLYINVSKLGLFVSASICDVYFHFTTLSCVIVYI